MSPLSMQLIVAIVVLLCFLGVLKLFTRFDHWRRLNVPYLEPCHFCGHREFRKWLLRSKPFSECLDTLYKEARARKLRYCGFFQFGSPLLMIVDPELVERILVKDFAHFTNHHDFKHDPNHLMSHQLYSMNDDHWKNLRRQLSSMFSATRMKLIANRMNDSKKRMNAYFDKKSKGSGWINVVELSLKMTADLICETLDFEMDDFDSFASAQTSMVIGKITDSLSPSIFSMLASYCFIFFPSVAFNFAVLNKADYRDLKALVEEQIQGRKAKGQRAEDLFRFFMELDENNNETGYAPRRKKETGISEEDLLSEGGTHSTEAHKATMPQTKYGEMKLIGQLFWTLMDAIETNSGPLSFCLHLLSLHPEHQRKIKDELESVQKKHDTDLITDDVLKDLKNLEKFIKESLRMYPAFIPLTRQCTKDYSIPNSKTIIPKGTVVMIPFYSFHFDPEYFPEPFEVRPDRFDENVSKLTPFTYLPFGNGPRGCIGARYAMTVMKFSVASIISGFEIRPINGKTNMVPLHPLSPIFIRPKESIFVRLKKREDEDKDVQHIQEFDPPSVGKKPMLLNSVRLPFESHIPSFMTRQAVLR